jgi:hypothetical protein
VDTNWDNARRNEVEILLGERGNKDMRPRYLIISASIGTVALLLF